MTQRVDASGQHGAPVTPSDTVNLTMPSGTNFTKGIYIGTSGDLKVKMASGADITYPNIAGGITHPISAQRVYATGTTVTGIIAVY